MKKTAILLALIIFLFSGCFLLESQVDDDFVITIYTPTPTPPIMTVAPTNTPAPITPTPEPVIVDLESLPEHSLNFLLQKEAPDTSNQVIFVAAQENRNRMYLMARQDNGLWKVEHGPYDIAIGQNGVGKEVEGDLKSPAGIYEIGSAFGRGDAPVGSEWPWRTTKDGDLWIEDSRSEHYNSYVHIDEVTKDWKNTSNLDIHQYRRALEIKYNPNNVPGIGSAIFIHVWAGPNTVTQGCTALNVSNLETTIAWLDIQSNPVFMQYEFENYLPKNYAYLVDYAPNAVSSLEYYDDENSLSKSIESYEKNTAIMPVDVAKGLDTASTLARRYDKYIVVYDSYRSKSANSEIQEWLALKEDKTIEKEFFYDLDLYPKGMVIDVGMLDNDLSESEMGSNFMEFDDKAVYDTNGLNSIEYNNREMLRDFMLQSGFLSDDNLWWHFKVKSTRRLASYDFNIR